MWNSQLDVCSADKQEWRRSKSCVKDRKLCAWGSSVILGPGGLRMRLESSGCLSYDTERQSCSGLRICQPKALAGRANCSCHTLNGVAWS